MRCRQPIFSRAHLRTAAAGFHDGLAGMRVRQSGNFRKQIWLDSCVFTGDKDELSKRGLKGLVNMGNTCFMSCILQALAHNPTLQTYFMHHHPRSRFNSINETAKFPNSSPTALLPSKTCIDFEVANLFASLFDKRSHKRAIVPHRMLYAAWKLAGSMAGYEQQDAHEFLLVLLDGLSQKAQEISPPTGFINEVFCGSLRSDIVLRLCS